MSKVSQEDLYSLTPKGVSRLAQRHENSLMLVVMECLQSLENKDFQAHTFSEIYAAHKIYNTKVLDRMIMGLNVAIRLGYIEKVGVRNTPSS